MAEPRLEFADSFGELHFREVIEIGGGGDAAYWIDFVDMDGDGDRFIAVEQSAGFTEILILQNWFEELKERVPTGRR